MRVQRLHDIRSCKVRTTIKRMNIKGRIMTAILPAFENLPPNLEAVELSLAPAKIFSGEPAYPLDRLWRHQRPTPLFRR